MNEYQRIKGMVSFIIIGTKLEVNSQIQEAGVLPPEKNAGTH